jgi:hypothetical protein
MDPKTAPAVSKLQEEWLELVSTAILKPEILRIVMAWLPQHPAYDQATFWSLPDEAGALPLLRLQAKTAHPTHVLPAVLPHVQKLATPEQVASQFNVADHGGVLFVQRMWKGFLKAKAAATNQSWSSGSVDEAAQQWLKALDLTEPSGWLWMDEPQAEPGSALRSAMMELLSKDPSSKVAVVANEVLARLAKAYPAKPAVTAPSESPWRGALSAPRIEALATQGHRLDEYVRVGELEVPAWQWILMHASVSPALSKEVLRVAQEQDLAEDVQQWKQAQEQEAETPALKSPRWETITPTDRRASSGYVAKVLKFSGQDGEPVFDRYGRSPLDYLLGHRSDLFSMFADRAFAMPSEEFVARFAQPDAAGVPAQLRYLSCVPAEEMGLLERLMTKHGCWESTADLLTSRGGLFKYEQFDVAGWSNAVSSRSSGSDFPVERHAHLLADPSVLFGDASQQKQWQAWWEKNMPLWLGAREFYTSGNSYHGGRALPTLPEDQRFFRQAHRHLLAYLANGASPQWEQGLDPDLRATLHVAVNLMTTVSNSSSSWFASSKKWSHELQAAYEQQRTAPPSASGWKSRDPGDSWSVNVSRNPPQALTPALVQWLQGPDGEKALIHLNGVAELPGRHYSWTKEVRDPWDTWFRRQALMLEVKPGAHPATRSPI